MTRFLFSAVFISCVIIICGMFRGFDFSDEGLYVFLADPDQSNDGGIFNYDLFFKLINKMFGIEFGIVGLRWIRFLSYFAGAWALAIFSKNVKSEESVSTEVFLIGLIGIFTGYAFLPSSLSYNSITVVLACVWLAIISKKQKRWTELMMIGIVLGILFYVKITSCLILGGLTLLISLFKKEISWKYIPALLIPFLIIEFVFFIAHQETGFTRIVSGLEMMTSRQDYGFLLLFRYLAVGVYWLVLVFIPFWIAGYYYEKSNKKSILFAFLGFITLISIFIYTLITDEWNHAVLLSTSSVFGFVLGKYGIRNHNLSQQFLFVLLIGMPYFLFFGSNVYWLRIGIHYWVFWIFGLMMFFSQFSQKTQNALKTSIAFISIILVANGVWFNPFGQVSLFDADKLWEYGEGKTILLSKKQVDLLTKLKQKTDLYSNDEVFAFYRIPGILYMLDINSPKSPGFWNRSHLISYFPEGIRPEMVIFADSDSLPSGDWGNFKKENYPLSEDEEIQVLWR